MAMESEAVVGKPEGVRGELHEMCQQTVEMLELAWKGFRKQYKGPLELAEKLGREVHQREKALTKLAVKKSAGQAAALGADQELLLVPMHLERIGDNIEFLVRAIRTMVREGILFTDQEMSDVNALFEQAIGLVECVRDVIRTKNRVLLKHMVEEGQRYEEMANEYTLFHQQRLLKGVGMPKASSVYVAIVDYFKGIESHIRQIAQKLSAVAES
jgi:Na+/phosphate symporter